VYARHIVDSSPLPDPLTARTRLHYNQYEKHNPRFVRTLLGMTGGRFRTGMIARLVLREFWMAGKAPTMRQFADAWMDANAAHVRPRAEGAYLVDRFNGLAGSDWKQVRKQKAAEACASSRPLSGRLGLTTQNSLSKRVQLLDHGGHRCAYRCERTNAPQTSVLWGIVLRWLAPRAGFI
jgi:hypothetical protein